MRASNFAYLEHLLRLSTPKEEVDNFIETLGQKLSKKMRNILEINLNSQAEAFEKLQNEIELEDLDTIENAQNHLISYELKHSKLKNYESDDDLQMKPICYLLISKRGLYILYTPFMTFLDGFDPFSGKHISPLIAPNFIISAVRILYINFQKTKDEKPETYSKKHSGMSVFNASDAGKLTGVLDSAKIQDVLERVESPFDELSKSELEKTISPKGQISNIFVYDESLNETSKNRENQEALPEEILNFSFDASSYHESASSTVVKLEPEIKKVKFKNTESNERQPTYQAVEWRNTEKKITKNRDFCGTDACTIF